MSEYNLTRKPEEIVRAVQHQYFEYNANTNSFYPMSVPIKEGEVIEIPHNVGGVFIPMDSLETRAITHQCVYDFKHGVDNDSKYGLAKISSTEGNEITHGTEGVFIPTKELKELEEMVKRKSE